MIRRTAGFTLLEVLVAFTVLALTFGGLLQVFGSGLRGASEAREHAEAMYIAQSLVDGLDPERLAQDGRSTGTFDGYDWELDVAPYADASTPIDDEIADVATTRPVIVRAAVRWGDPETSVEVTTLRLRPNDEELLDQ